MKHKVNSFIACISLVLCSSSRGQRMSVEDVFTSTNSTMSGTTRNGPLGPPKMVDESQKPMRPINEEEDIMRDALKASGIEVLLPLDCGRHPRAPELRLNNTLPTTPLPWIAALGSRINGLFYFRCTGVVVSESHILTDGSCATSPTVNMAQLNVSSLPGNHPVENFIVGRRIHPSLRSKKDFVGGVNIGLLELAYPLKFDEYVQPICLPGIFGEDVREITNSFRSTLVGFDNIKDGKEGHRSANLNIVSNALTEYAQICAQAVQDFNKDPDFRKSTLHQILTKDHLCVYKIFDEVGQTVVLTEKKDSSGTNRVSILAVGGFANANFPIPIAFSIIQPQRQWIDQVIQSFRSNA